MKETFICRLIGARRSHLFRLCFLLLLSFNAFAITITGPTKLCPGASATYTVGGLPAGTNHWKWYVNDPGAGVVHDRVVGSGWDFPYTFANTAANAIVVVEAWAGFIKLGEQSLNVSHMPPSPGIPNNGFVLGCSANQEVPISSLPILQNNAADCFFHCAMRWSAPSGWNLKRTGFPNSNPLNFAESVVFPSGLSNGNVGNLTVTAMYADCGGFINTSSSATLWYGPPIVQFPHQQLFDAGSNMWELYHSPQPGTTSSWSVVSGSASVVPVGVGVYASSMSGAVVQLTVTNSCGVGTPYNFNIPPAGSMLLAYPNPAKTTLTLQLKDVAFKDLVPDQVWLYSEKTGAKAMTIPVRESFGKTTDIGSDKIDVDVEKLPRGTYYLHIPNSQDSKNSKVEKLRLILE